MKGSGRLQSIVQHLAGGVVFAAVAFEITPDLIARQSPIPTAIGFIAAVLTLLLLAKAEDSGGGEAGKSRLPRVYLCAIAIDLLLDGFVIGIGFSGGARRGRLLTFALTLELVALGLALVGELRERGLSATKAFGVTAAVSTTLIAGTGIGVGLLGFAPAWAVTAASWVWRSGVALSGNGGTLTRSPRAGRHQFHNSYLLCGLSCNSSDRYDDTLMCRQPDFSPARSTLANFAFTSLVRLTKDQR